MALSMGSGVLYVGTMMEMVTGAPVFRMHSRMCGLTVCAKVLRWSLQLLGVMPSLSPSNAPLSERKPPSCQARCSFFRLPLRLSLSLSSWCKLRVSRLSLRGRRRTDWRSEVTAYL